MNNCPLPEDPERMIFCSVSWAQTARNWTFWDCEPKEIAPPLSCFCQVFWSLQHKSNSWSGMYKFHDESAASSLAFIPTQPECKMRRLQRLLFKPAIDLCHLPSATKQTTSNRLAWKISESYSIIFCDTWAWPEPSAWVSAPCDIGRLWSLGMKDTHLAWAAGRDDSHGSGLSLSWRPCHLGLIPLSFFTGLGIPAWWWGYCKKWGLNREVPEQPLTPFHCPEQTGSASSCPFDTRSSVKLSEFYSFSSFGVW